MNNPFEIIDARLRHIECLLLDIKYPLQSNNPIRGSELVKEVHMTGNSKKEAVSNE